MADAPWEEIPRAYGGTLRGKERTFSAGAIARLAVALLCSGWAHGN